MYCANCRTDVAVNNGYCSKCGVAVSARLCAKGHVMDPSWTECRLCSPGTPAGTGKGRTLIENPPGGSSGSPQVGAAPRPGGFVKGATLLEDNPPGSGRPAASGTKKNRTVFDPGLAAPGAAPSAPAPPLPKLVGWLVTFAHTPSGDDFRLREGRNTIGSDPDCDVILNYPSVSSKHALIMVRDGKFQIRDNDSTNGTYVNGEDVFGKGAVVIENGSKIRIGDSECVLYAIAH